MADPPVVNASPLIVLSKAGCLDLLKLEGETVLVPDAMASNHRLDASGYCTVTRTLLLATGA
ncbi:MAG: hypothetical protein HYX75_08740 [Acidobacteria bacterium]|nr:hypothetical protein [Acidobacteriota bacterium]